jgi:hypothetical protein
MMEAEMDDNLGYESQNDLAAMITAIVTSSSLSTLAMEAWISKSHRISNLPSNNW